MSWYELGTFRPSGGKIMDIQEAVILLHDIARKFEKNDIQLALEIRAIADKVNAKKTFLDESDMETIRKAT